MAVVAVWTLRRNGRVVFWAGVALWSLGVAYRLPVFELFNHLPVFAFSLNGRLRLVACFAVAVLAASGLDRLQVQLSASSCLMTTRRDVAIGTH